MAHPYLKLHLPPNSPFELKPSPGKGWGGFATKNIARGDMILTEAPLFVVDTSNSSTVVREMIVKGFMNLVPADKQQFDCVRHNGNELFKSPLKAFEENSFQPANSPHRSLYVLHSRFNHSCVPNARHPIKSGNMELVAAKDIAAGEEITFCYAPSDYFVMTRSERHKEMMDFTCNCRACLLGTPYQELSDMRRRFLRGLQYIIRGFDIHQERDTSATPLICDPALKKMAENNRLNLSISFVVGLLFVCLSEAEGIMDDTDVETQEEDLRNMAAAFKTSKNFQVAKHAMQQPTWSGRFWIALGVWREFDQDDYIAAMERKAAFERWMGLSLQQ